MQFQYLIDKVNSADFEEHPFSHVQIKNFLSDGHFQQIVAASEIAISGFSSDQQLFAALFDKGYKIIEFPGCITDREVYLRWHRDKDSKVNYTNTACEGFGVTLRLVAQQSSIISDLSAFMASKEFQASLAAKFGIEFDSVTYDTGIQKYLDGYEISPHPDTRNKALTYMVNINPNAHSEKHGHHTHYLKFREEFNYVQAYWEGHPKEDRCWVPWTWCESQKVQRENNSIVIFAPRNNTIHAVKASYNHLDGQRTQMYGNLWHREVQATPGPEWENFVIKPSPPKLTLAGKVKSVVPREVKALIKAKGVPDVNVMAGRVRRS